MGVHMTFIESSRVFQLNIRRGRVFEVQEKAEWRFMPSARRWYEHTIPLIDSHHARGRVDVLMQEYDGSLTLIEVKATNWDRMRDYRVRPNVQRHARQVWSYILSFWERGIDVCPALVYPRAPASFNRRLRIENLLGDRWVQVVWADEREEEISGTALNQSQGSVNHSGSVYFRRSSALYRTS
jgi:hypothetical protein